MSSLHNDEQGVTLIELLLAMTLLTTVMVIATAGFIGMNRVFTRGVIRKELSESSQRVIEEITKLTRVSGSQPEVVNCSGIQASSKCQKGIGAVCVDKTRYYWYVPELPQQDTVRGGLYKDVPAACNSVPTAISTTTIVDPRFKVRDLSVNPVVSTSNPDLNGLFRVAGVLTAGEADAFNNLETGEPFSIGGKGTAQSSAVQTCSVESFQYVTSGSRRP